MAEILSLMYYVVFIIAVLSVAHILNSGVRTKTAWLAIIVAAATALRNFCYSMRGISISFSEAYFWTYFAALAWTLFYYVVLLWYLHYLQIKNRKFLGALATVAYIAALWFFVLSPNSRSSYNIVASAYGMVDVNYFYGISNSLVDIARTVVTIMVIISVIAVITYRLYKSKEEDDFSKVKLVNLWIGFTIVMALFVDEAAQVFVSDSLPSLSPIVSVIVVITIIRCMNKDGDLLHVKDVFSSVYSNINIEEAVWKRIELLTLITGVAYFAGMRIFFSNTYSNYEYLLLAVSILVSMFLGISGRALQGHPKALRAFRVSLLFLDMLALYLYNMPRMLTTIWMYPFCFVPMLVLLKQKMEMVIVVVMSLLFNFYLFVNYQSYFVYNELNIVIIRVLLTAVFCVQIIDANNVFLSRGTYTQKLRNLHERFSEISASYIKVTQDNIAEKTERLLKICGDYVGADRTFILMFDHQNDRVYDYKEVGKKELGTIANVVEKMNLKPLQWLIDAMQTNNIARVDDVGEMPIYTKNDIVYLAISGMRSLYCAPIMKSNIVSGMICVAYYDEKVELLAEDADFLLYAANTQSSALSLIESQLRINYVAYYNTLTNLPNKFEFMKRLEEYYEQHGGESFALVFLDIDSFQEINDTIGHDDGDELLVMLSDELSRKIGGSDILAHYSGDEFAMLLGSVSSKHEVALRLEEIIAAVRKPKHMLGREFFVTASIGVSVNQIDSFSLEELIKNAELAQFVAKRSGKNRFVICDESMKLENRHNQNIKSKFESAIDSGELEMYYQPVLLANGEELVGLEALLRWNSRDFGQLRPGDFFGISDEFGTDMRLSHFIVSQSLAQLRRWNEGGYYPRLTINFTDKQLNNMEFLESFEGYISDMQIDPAKLVVEFSERFGDDIENESLKKLREMGVCLSIDDFGSRNSSLSRIVNLDVNEIKIDKGFIHRIGMSDKDNGIVISIIEMARSLGMRATALGIETNDQYEFFKNSDCDYVQGYLFYEPMNAQDATDLLMFSQNKKGLNNKMPVL